MEKQMSENLIRYEAVVNTPLKEAFDGIELDRKLELVEVIIEDVRSYTENNNLQLTRKAWVSYQKQADWSALAKTALEKERKNNSLVSRAVKQLEKTYNSLTK